jgi:hypothetical protein
MLVRARAGDVYLYKQVPANVRDPVGEQALRDDFYRSQARFRSARVCTPLLATSS